MKLSYNLLKQYVALPDDLTMEQLAYDLTMRTVEVEGTTNLAEQYEHIVAGKILSVAPHPDADRLRIVQVDVGPEGKQQIVCGGSNLYEGHYVAVTLPGAHAVWHGEGEPVLIEAAALRGVDSYGMIAAASEIGLDTLFPTDEPHHILDLTEEGIEEEVTLKPGMPLAEVLGLNDEVLEIENKSITNRPDLWGHYGIARELAAIYHTTLKPMDVPAMADVPTYPVQIEAPELCSRMMAAHYTGVDTRRAPLWMRALLMKCDIRPITALVDMTNFVMIVYGQPTHAYDANHIEGGLVARRAGNGEALELLDGKELSLSSEDLVIADHKKALGLAGAMGGKLDSIGHETQETVLEIANFNPATIRKTAQKFAIRTEASSRNEKGIDSERIDPTYGLWQKLMKQIFPDAALVAYANVAKKETEKAKITLSLEWLIRRLGRSLTIQELHETLEPLGFVLEAKGTNAENGEHLLEVTAPTWRSTGDISLPDDILEEVARMIGYENFERISPTITLTGALHQPQIGLDRRLREYLAFACGFQELTSYPWVKEEYALLAGVKPDEPVLLEQAPAPDQTGLRTTHVPNIIEAIVKNVRFYDAFRIFEVGQVYAHGAMSPSSPDEVLPAMHRELAGAVVGTDPEELFYTVKGVLEGVGQAIQTPSFSFAQAEKPAWADKNAWLTIKVGDKAIGVMGLLSIKTKARADLKFQDACLFVLNLEELKAFDSRTNHFEHLPQYPHVYQDLSLLVKEESTWKDMEKTIGDRAVSITFVDEYRGKQIPEGHKSVTLRVELASEEGTLTAEEINAKMKDIREALADAGATLRAQ